MTHTFECSMGDKHVVQAVIFEGRLAQGRSYVGAWGAMAPPNFFNSPLELVKKNYKLLKLHVNLFIGPPKF